jgi:hypothetical protein
MIATASATPAIIKTVEEVTTSYPLWATIAKDFGMPGLIGTVLGSFTTLSIELLKRKFSTKDEERNKKLKVYAKLNSLIFSTKQLYKSRFEASIHSDYHEAKWIFAGHNEHSIDYDEAKRWMLKCEDMVQEIIKNTKELHMCLATIKVLFNKDTDLDPMISQIYLMNGITIQPLKSSPTLDDIEEWKKISKQDLDSQINEKISLPLTQLKTILDGKLCVN